MSYFEKNKSVDCYFTNLKMMKDAQAKAKVSVCYQCLKSR